MDGGVVVALRELWLVWLVLLFAGIVAYAYWPGRRRKMEEHGRIPFKENEQPQGGWGKDDEPPGGRQDRT